mmetsp:Transcript_29273/g.83185  ORF Transcript_29273/g.83185 Transcript_29273/m.83185 type:complete len:298 (-) Transcript_29273:185-1078(-)
MGDPTSQDIDDFIRSNDVDERAANDLRSCSGEIQRKVLSRGELSTARNPSAAVLARIRDARSSPSGGGGGARSSEVEDFIKNNDVDESAADMLRSSSPTVQRTVLSRGELKTARNPSSALLSRIRDAKSGGSDRDRDRGYGGHDGGMPPPPGGMPPMGMPPAGYAGYPGYGMYPNAYAGYPGYPGYMTAPQADSRGYSPGTMPQGGACAAYGGYPGGYGAYGAYANYYGMGASQAGPVATGYGASQTPAAQAPPMQQAAIADGGSSRRRSRSRSRGRSSSSSYSRSPSRRRRRRGRK